MFPADITAATSAVTAVGGLVVTAFGYIGYRSQRDRMTAIRESFDGVVGALAAGEETRRLAAAILLRRFFDEHSEMGVRHRLVGRRAPYAARR